MKNEFDIALPNSAKRDIASMIADLSELLERGSVKSYNLKTGQSVDAAILALHMKVMDLADEDEELESELREEDLTEEAARECGFSEHE